MLIEILIFIFAMLLSLHILCILAESILIKSHRDNVLADYIRSLPFPLKDDKEDTDF
jgi:cbb3-type cytochrome oxidase subunit 3